MAEKQDFMYVVLAIGIVLVIALIIKPAATGELPGLWKPGEPEPTVTPVRMPTYVPTTPPATPTPTPVPTWDGKPQDIGFVDPAIYHISSEDNHLNTTALSGQGAAPGITKWVTYATVDGQWSGTTGIVRIPFPLWRLDYSETAPANDEIPRFNCQIMDAEDPNRFVRVITLNAADFLTVKGKPELKKERWVSTFYEGNHDYYFVINARCIDAYHLKIQVPETYVSS